MKSLIQKLTIVACLVLILAEISFAQQKTQLPEGISLVDVGSDRDCFEVKNDTVRVVLGQDDLSSGLPEPLTLGFVEWQGLICFLDDSDE